MTPHAVLPVPIPAVTPVIAAAMIPVRPELLKTIPVLMLLRPNAVHVATGVKAARPVQVLLIQVLMPRLPSAAAAILVPILAVPEQRAVFPVPETMSPHVFLPPSVVPAAMNADITPIVTLLPNHVITAVLLRTLAANVHHASPSRLIPLLRRRINVREVHKGVTVSGLVIILVGPMAAEDIIMYKRLTSIVPRTVNSFAADKGIRVHQILIMQQKLNVNQKLPARLKMGLKPVIVITLTADVAATADIFDPACKKEAFQPPFQNSPKD